MSAGPGETLATDNPEIARDADAYARAVLNILDDFSREKEQFATVQRAMANILDDFSQEKDQFAAVQRAMANILDDFAEEKAHLDATQKAVLNILEDFELEKNKVERVNIEMKEEIAERKLAETALGRANTLAEAANKELEAFSYSVAHDLRSPLRSIDGFSQALLEDYGDRLDAEGMGFLNNVRESAQRMAQLIDDLLALSRVTRNDFVRGAVDIAAIARLIVTRLEKANPDRDVEVVIPDTVPAHGDSRLLAIVLENLLGNAWKFTSKREDARVEVDVQMENGERVYFVRDNGAGFDMAYAQKLFGVFQRLHSAADFEGTGIGLATVSRVIHRHGGRVWAHGEVGRGATFYFTLEDT